MDAPEDDLDIKLQKISGDLIADFDKSLGPFLRRHDGKVRSKVRSRETERLVSGLLNPFQELPQLLDPHLQIWLTPLVEAFLEYLLKKDSWTRHLNLQQQQKTVNATDSEETEPAPATAIAEPDATSDLLMPLPAAISKIIYTLCKIRGEKVIVQFLNNEAKYLEVLVSVLEHAEMIEKRLAHFAPSSSESRSTTDGRWPWEQRYVVLLWLSHLMLVPFDLVSISSVPQETPEEVEINGEKYWKVWKPPPIEGFDWPKNLMLPNVTKRILPVAIKYLSSPGKERDAAKVLLVRLATRRDMQACGILDELLKWAAQALESVPGGRRASKWGEQPDHPPKTPYFYIGLLGFLAGVLASLGDSETMIPRVEQVYTAVDRAIDWRDRNPEEITKHGLFASAMSRKCVIKVVRSFAVLSLQRGGLHLLRRDAEDIVETAIGFFLDSLGDKETPVRFAASKALSILTLKLKPDMADQVVEAVIESLSKNVLWHKDPNNPDAPKKRDLGAVDHLEWHGLMLTLAHLLYRRSPPAKNLPDIINSLILGLSFERRSPSGGSIGTNVRDAACFGIWALARRYSTNELEAVPTPWRKKDDPPQDSISEGFKPRPPPVPKENNPPPRPPPNPGSKFQLLPPPPPTKPHPPPSIFGPFEPDPPPLPPPPPPPFSFSSYTGDSILQILAKELILAACLDPSGNIRRGSSAALQELIGRHAGTVEEGIFVVQKVDYHGVALRSRAVGGVALDVANLGEQYGEVVLEGLLGWRGVGDFEAGARRAVSTAFGAVTKTLALGSGPSGGVARLRKSIELVLEGIKGLQVRQVEERHGLLLSLAAVVDELPEVINLQQHKGEELEELVNLMLDALILVLEDCERKTYRKPELIAEAASKLVVSAFPILQAKTIGLHHHELELLPGSVLVADDKDAISRRVEAINSQPDIPEQVSKIVALIKANLAEWLTRTEEEVLPAASDAALVMLVFSGKQDREATLKEWVERVRHRPTSGVRIKNTTGYFFAITKPYQIVETLDTLSRNETQDLVSKALNERWMNDRDVDTHVAILKSLTGTGTLRNGVPQYINLITDGLDNYTTNARGDVGSLVRGQAIRATRWLWEELKKSTKSTEEFKGTVNKLFLRILRLAAEKLDRVRVEAQSCLAVVLTPEKGEKLGKDTFSSVGYLTFLLELLSQAKKGEWLDKRIAEQVTENPEKWMEELLAGLVSSADTGNEDLVIASRQAVTEFCGGSAGNSLEVCSALVRNLKRFQGVDRVLVPTLEVIAFLFHVGIFAKCPSASTSTAAGEKGMGIDYKALCLQVQKAAYKTGNVRKIEACIRVYGGIASGLGKQHKEDGKELVDENQEEGIKEAKKRLGALMLHPWPRVKSLVADEIWGWSVTVGAEAQARAGVAPEEGEEEEVGDEFVDVDTPEPQPQERQEVVDEAVDVDTPEPEAEGPAPEFVGEQVLGVDWSKAGKGDIKAMVKRIGFVEYNE